MDRRVLEWTQSRWVSYWKSGFYSSTTNGNGSLLMKFSCIPKSPGLQLLVWTAGCQARANTRNTNFVKTPKFRACGIPKNRWKIPVFKMLSHFEFDGVLSVPEVCEVWYFDLPLQLCWDRKSMKMDTWYGRSSVETGKFLTCDTPMDRGRCGASGMVLLGCVGWGVWVSDPYAR